MSSSRGAVTPRAAEAFSLHMSNHRCTRFIRLTVPTFLWLATLLACDGNGPIAPRCGSEAEQVTISPRTPRQLTALGDTVRLAVAASNDCLQPLENVSITWSSSNSGVAEVVNGIVTARGNGNTFIRARSGNAVDSVMVTVEIAPPPPPPPPPPPASPFTVIGLGAVPIHSTTELWVQGDYAYTATNPSGTLVCVPSVPCQPLYVWRISETAAPVLVDSVLLPRAGQGDVMTSPDGTLGFVALQGSADNGFVVLDLANPARPTVSLLYKTNLEQGVHTLWYEKIAGRDYVFAVENGSNVSGGLHIVDITNITAPTEVSHFYAGTSFAHDVNVRDGLAFLSHWSAGMIILDVGNGIRGGSPTNPVEVSRISAGLASVHNITYWPARRLAFIGEERTNGRLQVVDLADLTQPRLIGFYEIAGGVPHNFWLDEAAGILFAAWYGNGVRAFDVSGDVTGDWRTTGKEIGFISPTGPRGPSNIWGPQLHRGVVYAADIANGLWAWRFARQ